jgi:hypothetical protein
MSIGARLGVARHKWQVPPAPGSLDDTDGRPLSLRSPQSEDSGKGTGWGWSPAFAVVAGGALLIATAANALSRSGRGGSATLFWIAVLALVIVAVFRLASPIPTRRERLSIAVMVGMTLYLVKVLKDPFAFTYSDEFIHSFNALKVLETGSLLHDNPILPVTPQFIGLPTATSAVASLGDLHVFGAGVIVIGAARLVMMFGLFLLFEEITRSSWIAGLATVFYAANPNYLFFTAQYAYESLALPLAILVMAVVTRWMHCEDRGVRRSWAVVALILIGTVVMTHHMTAYALLAFLAAVSVVHALVARRGKLPNPWPFGVFAAAATTAWLIFVASEAAGYLTFIFHRAAQATIETITRESPPRQLFTSESGEESADVERFIGLAAIGLITLALPFALQEVWRRYRRHPVGVLLAAAAICYPGVLMLRFVPGAWEVGNRSSEFLFIGVALMLALVATRISSSWRGFAGRTAVTGAAAIIFAGGVIVSWPADARTALPYRISAQGSALEPQGAAAARWAKENADAGTRFATDQSNSRLFVAQGLLAYTGSSPNVQDVISFSLLDPFMVDVLKTGRIRYVVMDRRYIRDDRTVGYFFTSPRAKRSGIYPWTWYEKFERQRGVSKLFDSGDIAIYDVEGLRYDPKAP